MDIETYLSGFDKAEKINKGMARDDKYRCRRGREEYLLRVADGEDFAEKKKEFEHLKRLSEAGLPVPKCVELVKNDDGSKVFTRLSWVTGEDLESESRPGVFCEGYMKPALKRVLKSTGMTGMQKP